MKQIYLDSSATTPIDPKVLEAMKPYLEDNYGNASSLHQMGLDNRVAVDRSQATVAKFLNCEKSEVYFTSGATESDNMSILGIVKAARRMDSDKKIHIITTRIEHDAILEPCQDLEKEGVEVTYLPINKKGIVKISELSKAIKPSTILVSVMYVNNEVGTIQPIAEMGEIISRANKNRKQKIYYHTDATQAPSYCNCSVKKLGVDLLSMSGHKIYGPKGVGVIYVKKGTEFLPIMLGGHQQEGVRSGTYNVPGIVGLAKAVDMIMDRESTKKHNKKIKELRDYLLKNVSKSVPRTLVNGDSDHKVESNAHFIFQGIEGESALLMLSKAGVAVSTGSACSSGSLEPSHVLMAMGVGPEHAHGSMRATLNKYTTKADIDYFLKVLPPIVEKLRSISPIK